MSKHQIAATITRLERSNTIEETARIAEVKAMGYVPSEAGPMIPEAPARGPVRMMDMMAAYPKGETDFEMKPAGYRGRKTLQRADSFDVMAAKAARHRKPCPFSPAQIAMGRFYRDLVEKHECAGVRCSSLEAFAQRGGTGGEFMDAVLRDRQRIDVLRKRIGSGSAMVAQRIRPSKRGSRVSIMDRRLVDIVCLEDGTISDVLRAHGWTVSGEITIALSRALALILDRMMGPVKGRSASFAHFGSGCLPVWD